MKSEYIVENSRLTLLTEGFAGKKLSEIYLNSAHDHCAAAWLCGSVVEGWSHNSSLPIHLQDFIFKWVG